MIRNFQGIREQVIGVSTQRVIAVAAAQDEDVLGALKIAREMKLGEPVLIGDRNKILNEAEKIEFDLSEKEIVHEPDTFQAARKAVALVKSGDAHVLMKGLISTAIFLKAVLEKENGLKSGQLLSHVAVFHIPKLNRLLLVTDCAMNIAPGVQEKTEIIKNALCVTKALDIPQAKIAAVCAVETVNPGMPATVDAAILAKMCDRKQLSDGLLDGPLALDNAVSIESALHKGINSPVAGEADIILVPDIEAGNVLYKSLVFLAEAENAGVIMGAAAPIVLTSRSDSMRAKLNSIALSLLLSNYKPS